MGTDSAPGLRGDGAAVTPHPEGSRLTFTLLYEVGVGGNPSRWRFVLRSDEGHDELVAEDEEPGTVGERLELLTIVRALESLNQSVRVIIWTRSPSVREGLLYGLAEWPANGWQWEHFDGHMPVKNRDLWVRIARAARFHTIECRIWRFDPPHFREAQVGSPGKERTTLALRAGDSNDRRAGTPRAMAAPNWAHALQRLVSWMPRLAGRSGQKLPGPTS